YPIPPSPDKSPTRLTGRAHFSGRAVGIRLSCPSTKGSCAGTVRLETVTAFAARRGKGKAKHRGRLLLGQTPFAISGGQHQTVTVRLSARGVALLKKLGRLS